jgi:peptidoglycan hydrolase-like protein with peptidoglycan-binding domain
MLAVGLVVGASMLPAATADARMRHFGDRSLGPGSRGHDVRVLQDFLTRVGISTPVDGQYGPYTTRRVRTWERHSGRAVNGRMSRRNAGLLRSQVSSGQNVMSKSTSAQQPAPTGAKATLGSDGQATAPASAPQQVKDVIAAANHIAGRPYKYGGGHGQWEDSGYDCSGSESYALKGADLVSRPMNSSEFMSWGEPGEGTWITSYAHGGHSFLVVAGLRFDTGYNDSSSSGPKWSAKMRPTAGFTVRHPAGL